LDPLPIVTIAGIIYVALLLTIVYYYWAVPALGFLHPLWDPIYITVIIIGILWYAFWYYKRKKEGIDITLAYKELPPE